MTQQFKKNHLRHLQQRFAKTFDQAAFLHKEIAERLVEHLAPIKLQPKVILDLGAKTGYSTQVLKKHYPKATIIATDMTTAMLKIAKKQGGWLNKPKFVCADYEKIPLADQSVDLIFSNLAFAWCNDLNVILQECRRVLRPDGLLLFSTFGPDTLKEIKQSWMYVDETVHVHDFIDMHDIGDLLVQHRLADPVMEMEYLTLTYSTITELLQEIKLSGYQNSIGSRTNHLMTKNKWQEFLLNLEKFRTSANLFSLTFEIIYGHAWCEKDMFEQAQHETVIPISSIKVKKN